MNVWLVAATVLLGAVAPCGWLLMRATVLDGLVALELATTLTTLVLVLLAEGFHRSSYFTVPLVLAAVGFVGTLVFARFLGGGRL